MAVLRKGVEYNEFMFERPWFSNWFVSTSTSVVGFWLYPYRELKPASWDLFGYAGLQVRTNPQQVILTLESDRVIFDQGKGFLFPPALVGSEFRLVVTMAEWINLVSMDWGIFTF